MSDALQKGHEIAERFQEDTGAPCAVRVLTYNQTSGTRSPDYAFVARDVPFSIASIASIADPSIISKIRGMNIDQTRYRLLTCAAGKVTVPIQKDDRIIKEPAVIGVSDTYQVIEALAPDETSSIELTFHCQKM